MPNNEIVVPQDQKELHTEVEKSLSWSNNIVIQNQAQFDLIDERRKSLKPLKDKINGYFKPLTDAANAAHKALTRRRSDELRPLEQAEDRAKTVQRAWIKEQERIAEEQRKKDEEERLKRETAEKKKIDKKIDKAIEKGDENLLETLEVEKEEVYIPPTNTVEKLAPTYDQRTFKKRWAVSIVDKKKVPLEYLNVNVEALEKIAKATKGSIKIPGIRFHQE